MVHALPWRGPTPKGPLLAKRQAGEKARWEGLVVALNLVAVMEAPTLCFRVHTIPSL